MVDTAGTVGMADMTVAEVRMARVQIEIPVVG